MATCNPVSPQHSRDHEAFQRARDLRLTSLVRLTHTAVLSVCLLGACTHYESLEVDGVEREFLVHVPPGETPDQGWPLVLAYHGAYTTPENTETYTGLSILADAEGFVVVYPRGKQRLWNDGRVPDAYDDVAFTAALIDHLIDEYEVDEGRVFATGISNGAFMSHRVGCELGDRIAGIAPVAGSLSEELLAVCEPVAPVPVMLVMGTEDRLVPYEGGSLGGGFVGGRIGTLLSGPQSAAHWAGLNGCDTEPVATERDELDDGTRLSSVEYHGCAAEVVFHTIDGGGHTWPGARHVVGLGTVSAELDASAEIWRFFAAQGS